MKRVFLLSMALIFSLVMWGQKMVSYNFTTGTATYTTIAGIGTGVVAGDKKGGVDLDLTGLFSFPYNGQIYSVFGIRTDGVIRLGGGSVSYYNNLASTSYYPVVAPLWDDMDVLDSVYVAVDTATGVMVVEWHNIKRYGADDADTVNFQLWLYEDGRIMFWYDDMTNAGNWSSATASIGFNNNENGTTKFVSLTPGNPPTISTTTANNSIDGSTIASIEAGTYYLFTPPAKDLAPVAVLEPQQNFDPSASTPLKFVVVNQGTQDVSDYSVTVLVKNVTDNTTLLDSTISGLSLAAFGLDTFTINFASELNKTYNFTIYVYSSEDEDNSNDTLSAEVDANMLITSLPYTQGFEGPRFPPAGWHTDTWFLVDQSVYDGNYAVTVKYNQDGILTSPALVHNGSVRVSFWWRDDDYFKVAGHDTTFFEYSLDSGRTWITLDTLAASSSESEYHQAIHYVQINDGDTAMFRFRNVTDGSYSAYGTLVDNFSIEEAVLYDVAVEEITSPPAYCLPDSFPIIARIVNYGVMDASNFNVTAVVVDLNTGDTVLNNTVLFDDVLSLTEDTMMNLGQIYVGIGDMYSVTVSVEYSDDEVPANNEMGAQVRGHLLITSLPYTQDFENGGEMPEGWVSINGYWTIADNSYAVSGDYVVRVSYSHDGEAWLVSPAFLLNGDVEVSWYWIDRDIYKVAGHDTTFAMFTTDGETWVMLDTLSASGPETEMHQAVHQLTFDNDTVVFVFLDVTDATGSAYGTGIDDFAVQPVVTNVRDANSLTVYPNPVDDVLYIKLDKPATVQIMSMDGKLIRQLQLNGQQTINLQDLEAGSYLIRAITADGIYVSQIVKK